jgi:hypothetical protein
MKNYIEFESNCQYVCFKFTACMRNEDRSFFLLENTKIDVFL